MSIVCSLLYLPFRVRMDSKIWFNVDTDNASPTNMHIPRGLGKVYY